MRHVMLDARDQRWEQECSEVVDGVNVGEAVLVQKVLHILGEEALVCCEEVEHMREGVFGL